MGINPAPTDQKEELKLALMAIKPPLAEEPRVDVVGAGFIPINAQISA
jgi:hypothetical protein